MESIIEKGIKMENDKMGFGDEKFKEYMGKIEKFEEGDSLDSVLNTLKYKITIISDLYSKSVETYIAVEKDDPIKKDLSKYINQLIEHSIQTFDQFNYILIDIEDNNDNEETTGDKLNGEENK